MAAFYLDEGIPISLADILTETGHDTITAFSQGMKGRPDGHHLLLATQQQRTVITYDNGFITLHDAWRRWTMSWSVQARHSGILVASQRYLVIPDILARSVNEFLQTSPVLSNELYVWDRTGWFHRPWLE